MVVPQESPGDPRGATYSSPGLARLPCIKALSRPMILRFLAWVLAGFLLLAVLITLLWHQIGAWTLPVVLGLLIAAGGAGWLLRERLMEGLFSIPFRAKGAALRGATAEFHDACILGEEGARIRVRADVTITPSPSREGPFRHWEIGEVMLVPKPARGRSLDKDLDDCETECVLAWNGSEFAEPEFDKVPGPLRLQITGALPAGTQHVSIRYYFEVFGEGRIKYEG